MHSVFYLSIRTLFRELLTVRCRDRIFRFLSNPVRICITLCMATVGKTGLQGRFALGPRSAGLAALQ